MGIAINIVGKVGLFLLASLQWAPSVRGQDSPGAAIRPVRMQGAQVYRSEKDRTLLFRYQREEFERPLAGAAVTALSVRELTTTDSGVPSLTEAYDAYPGESGGREVYHMVRQEPSESAEVSRVGDSVRYRLTRKDGSVREASEKAGADWTLVTRVPALIRERWGQLLKGEGVRLQLAVPERLESLAFELVADPASLPPGKNSRGVRILLRPRSFFLKFWVHPIEIWMEPDASLIRSITGRTRLWVRSGEGWSPLTGHMEFIRSE